MAAPSPPGALDPLPRPDRCPVNSHTEWGPLREVIVGQVANCYLPKVPHEADLSFQLFYYDNLRKRLKKEFYSNPDTGPEHVQLYDRLHVEERTEDVEGLVQVLTGLGIRVRRPEPLAELRPTATGEWRSLTSPAHNVRDQTLIVGDEIIETPPLCRNRYFENDLMKPLFLDYFRRGARWTAAPRPLMREASFDWSWVEKDRPDKHGPADHGQFEIMFDAAQCLRFGRDILFNAGNANHRLGADWLARHLGPEYRVHVLDGLADNHVDTMLMPLRLGVLLVNARKMAGKWHLLPEPLQRWTRIDCTEVDETAYTEDDVLLASESISANVLPIGDDRVIVGAPYRRLMADLERHGFEPVPVQLRHSRIYAGGFHCITLDVHRDEELGSFF